MRKKAAATPIEDQLRDFELPPGMPKNAGNFPDELDPALQAAPPPPLAAETPEPEPEPEPEPDAAPAVAEPETDEPARETADDRRVRELEERLAARDRELSLVRAGYPQGPPPQPAAQAQPVDAMRLIDQYLGGYQVSAADVQTILSDPEKGAEYLQNGIRAAVAAGAALALAQARAEFQGYQQEQQGAHQLREYFYGQNPDLAPYAKLVGTEAIALKQQYPNATNEALCNEVARRVRGQLKEWGVKPTAPAGAAPRAARSREVRPAYGDMGGGARGGGSRALSPIEKQLRDFEAGTQHFRG